MIRSTALQTAFLLLLITPACPHHHKPTPVIPPPDIGADATQSLQMVIRQADDSREFVARFKARLNNFNSTQIHIAQEKYLQTTMEVNPTVEELKKVIAGTSTLTEAEFKTKARSAVETNAVFSTVMANALNSDPGNFVLNNVVALADAWTTVWRVSHTLTPQQKQLFGSFLDVRVHYKTFEEIPKQQN